LLRNAFPTREEHLEEAHEVLAETISAFQSRKCFFDPGKGFLWFILNIDFLFIDFSHSREMDIVVSFPIF
jgi:hypothetical protein